MLRLWTSESAPYDGCKYRNHLVTPHLDQYSQFGIIGTMGQSIIHIFIKLGYS